MPKGRGPRQAQSVNTLACVCHLHCRVHVELKLCMDSSKCTLLRGDPKTVVGLHEVHLRVSSSTPATHTAVKVLTTVSRHTQQHG
jgi:hypothetical protein